jgi:hypothetical protein
MPGASSLELRMAVPGRALFSVARARAAHVVDVDAGVLHGVDEWISGLIYGCSSSPNTLAETFAERVVIREDCICLQMTSPHRPALIAESPTERMKFSRYRG